MNSYSDWLFENFIERPISAMNYDEEFIGTVEVLICKRCGAMTIHEGAEIHMRYAHSVRFEVNV